MSPSGAIRFAICWRVISVGPLKTQPRSTENGGRQSYPQRFSPGGHAFEQAGVHLTLKLAGEPNEEPNQDDGDRERCNRPQQPRHARFSPGRERGPHRDRGRGDRRRDAVHIRGAADRLGEHSDKGGRHTTGCEGDAPRQSGLSQGYRSQHIAETGRRERQRHDPTVDGAFGCQSADRIVSRIVAGRLTSRCQRPTSDQQYGSACRREHSPPRHANWV